MRLVVPLATVVLAVSCSGVYPLPDRTDDAVRESEADLAQVVVADRGGGDCDVRLLGQAGRSSFIWAECRGPVGAISAPMRVDGDQVTMPGDGNQYTSDVVRMFPSAIAEAILSDQDRLRP